MSESNLPPPPLSPRENNEESNTSPEIKNNKMSEPSLQIKIPKVEDIVYPYVKPLTQFHLLRSNMTVKNRTRKRSSKVKKLFELKSSRNLRTSQRFSKLNTTCSKISSVKASPTTLEAESFEGPQCKFKFEPELFGYQMVGDSQFCRFGEQLLGLERGPDHHPCGNIGICVSGQTIPDLHKRVKEKFYPLSDKIILMIGTNDFLRNKDVTTICQELSDLVNTIQKMANNIVLLTLPPIPRLERRNGKEHFIMLEKYNQYIQGMKDGDRIRVADVSSMYITPSQSQCNTNLFEKYFGGMARRYDMIHLNRKGLEVMRKSILENLL